MADSKNTDTSKTHRPTDRSDLPPAQSTQDKDGRGQSRDTGPNNQPTNPSKAADKSKK